LHIAQRAILAFAFFGIQLSTVVLRMVGVR
jgi:hypothetical protein